MQLRNIAIFTAGAALLLFSCLPLRMMKKFNSGQGFISEGVETVIPFELRGHAPVVEVSFNDNPEKFRLIMDTGAMTFIQEDAAARIDHLERGEVPAFDKERNARLAEFAAVECGKARVENLIGVVFNFMDKTGYDDTDGLLGSDFLRFYRIEFDYAEQTVTLSLNSEPLTVSIGAVSMPVEMPLPIRAPMVECMLNDAIEGQAMIDTGSPYGIVLPLEYREKLKEADDCPVIEAAGIMAKWPMSKRSDSYLSRLTSMEMGDLRVENVLVIFADVEWILLGKAFLDEYRFTIDYPLKTALFEPVQGMEIKHNVFSTGLGLKRDKSGEVVVKGYWKGSPAEKGGIKVGDKIVRIGNLSAGDTPLWKLYEPLNDDDVKIAEIEILRDGEAQTVILEKEFLLTINQELK